ncbi:hypothetical protein ACE6H2_000921 [Prunus campanulata]
MAVMRPRLKGDKKPSNANIMVTISSRASSWVSNSFDQGGRNSQESLPLTHGDVDLLFLIRARAMTDVGRVSPIALSMGWLDCDLVGLASISLSDLVKRQRGARGGFACVVSGMSAGRW